MLSASFRRRQRSGRCPFEKPWVAEVEGMDVRVSSEPCPDIAGVSKVMRSCVPEFVVVCKE